VYIQSRLVSNDSRSFPVAGCSEYDIEYSGYIKDEKFLDRLSNYHELKSK